MADKKCEPFLPKTIEEIRGEVIGDQAFRVQVLREAQRWAKHCGHYSTENHLNNYLKLVLNL